MGTESAVEFRIQRYRPAKDQKPGWESYRVETTPGMTIVEGLEQIRSRTDPTLSWRYSCRMGICGSCGMIINGAPALACNTQILEVSRSRIRLQPLSNFAIVKDLVCDLTPMFHKHTAISPYLVRADDRGLEPSTPELGQTPDELTEYLQFSYCIKCGVCMAACPTLATDATFLGPMPLTAAHRYNKDSRDQGFERRKTELADWHATTHCHYAGECSRACPKGVDPARAIQLMKRDLVMDLLKLRRTREARPVGPPTGAVEPRPVPAFTVKTNPRGNGEEK